MVRHQRPTRTRRRGVVTTGRPRHQPPSAGRNFGPVVSLCPPARQQDAKHMASNRSDYPIQFSVDLPRPAAQPPHHALPADHGHPHPHRGRLDPWLRQQRPGQWHRLGGNLPPARLASPRPDPPLSPQVPRAGGSTGISNSPASSSASRPTSSPCVTTTLRPTNTRPFTSTSSTPTPRPT